MKSWKTWVILSVIFLLVSIPVKSQPVGPFSAGINKLVSLAPDGSQGNRGSTSPSITSDARYVVFESSAFNFVSGDTNGVADIFVRDQYTGSIERVSVASDGTQANGYSADPVISDDGRYIAFRSSATNLVPNDTNGDGDIFVHDRQTRQTVRVSVASDGTQGNNWSYSPTISADGRYIAFDSLASNLVPGDTNGTVILTYGRDVFIHDMQNSQTERVSVDSEGGQVSFLSEKADISADGRYVAFRSGAPDLVPGDANGDYDIFVHDRLTGEVELISVASNGTQGNGGSYNPTISADGRYVAFVSQASSFVANDSNNGMDVFVRDRQTGSTELISISHEGYPANDEFIITKVSISADGRYVAFSTTKPLTIDDIDSYSDVYLHDGENGTLKILSFSVYSFASAYGSEPDISADGRYIVFWTASAYLVLDDTNESSDVFIHDQQGLNNVVYLPMIQR